MLICFGFFVTDKTWSCLGTFLQSFEPGLKSLAGIILCRPFRLNFIDDRLYFNMGAFVFHMPSSTTWEQQTWFSSGGWALVHLFTQPRVSHANSHPGPQCLQLALITTSSAEFWASCSYPPCSTTATHINLRQCRFSPPFIIKWNRIF